jgi:NAD(P)-dependent dehydrogenase (short-subunit alcohol dehydrogenase family)
VVINSAGVGLPQSAIKPPGPDALAVLDINLFGTWRVNAATLPELRRSRGRILNIASGLSHLSMPFATAYCSSKRAVVGCSDSLRLEIGHEVEVTTVYPGYIKTPIHDESVDQGFSSEGLVPEEPLDRACETIASAALGRYRRDVATTLSGTLAYSGVRRLPRRIIDVGTMFSLRRQLKRDDFTHTSADGVPCCGSRVLGCCAGPDGRS